MSALLVVGEVVGVTVKNIQPRQGQTWEPFKVVQYYVMNGGDSAPIRVTGAGDEPKYKAHEKVKIPVWIKTNRNDKTGRVYTELREIKGQA
jgi:hypothetical protein